MSRRLRAIVRNAVVWGVGWGLAGFATSLALTVTNTIPGISVLDSLGMGIRIGIVGGIAGTLFSSLIPVFYRGRRLQDISWAKFGLGGAVVTAVGMPLFMQSASLISGGGLVPWEHLSDDFGLFVVFGGVAAALSMKLAQVADRRDPIGDELVLEAPTAAEQLNAGEREISVRQPARSDVRTS